MNGTRLTLLILSLFSLAPACATTLSGESTEGQVVEQGTNRPIPNAIVVVRWIGSLPAFVESQTVCVHVETATSNSEGKYATSAWRAPSHIGPVFTHFKPVVYAYRQGYAYEDADTGHIYLKPFSGAREERLNAIWSAGVQCGSGGESEKNFIPLYRTLYEEAKPLAQSADDKRIVDALLYELEKRELGYNAATKRMLERK